MSDLFTYTFFDPHLKFEMFKGAEYELICDAEGNIYDNVIDLMVGSLELQIDNFPFLYNLMNAMNIQYINKVQYVRDSLKVLVNSHIEIAKAVGNEFIKIMNEKRGHPDDENYKRGYL